MIVKKLLDKFAKLSMIKKTIDELMKSSSNTKKLICNF